MANLNPERSDNVILDKINEIISEHRPISVFEKKRLEDSLSSLRHSNMALYYAVNSGYKCITCDSDGVRSSINSLISLTGASLDLYLLEFAITSLANVFLFEDAYNLLSRVDFESRASMMQDDFLLSCLMIFILNNDDSKVNLISNLLSSAGRKSREAYIAAAVYKAINDVCSNNSVSKVDLTKFVRAGLEAFSLKVISEFQEKVFIPAFAITEVNDESISYLDVVISYPENIDEDLVYDSSDLLADIISSRRFFSEIDLSVKQLVVFSVVSGSIDINYNADDTENATFDLSDRCSNKFSASFLDEKARDDSSSVVIPPTSHIEISEIKVTNKNVISFARHGVVKE